MDYRVGTSEFETLAAAYREKMTRLNETGAAWEIQCKCGGEWTSLADVVAMQTKLAKAIEQAVYSL